MAKKNMMGLELLLSVFCMLNILKRNPQLCHTFSFGAHWSSYSNSSYKQTPSYPLANDYGILEVITTIPHECMSPRKLFCSFSHFILSCPLLHSPYFLSFITLNSTILLRIMDRKNKVLCLDYLTLVLERKKDHNCNKTKKWYKETKP